MKKSGQDREQTKISDLLKKLQASYLGSDKKDASPKKAEKRTESGDAELEDKLRRALEQIDGNGKKPKKSAKKPLVKKSEAKEEPTPVKAPDTAPITDKAAVPTEKVAVKAEPQKTERKKPEKEKKKATAPAPKAIPAVSEEPTKTVETTVEEAPPAVPAVEEAEAIEPSEPLFSAVEEAEEPKEDKKEEKETVPVIAVLTEDSPEVVETITPAEEEPVAAEELTTMEEPVAAEEPKKPLVRVIGVVEEEEAPLAPPEKKESDAIVIRPPSVRRKTQEPIVIRPKREDLTPTASDAPVSNEPIRIGKKSEPIPTPTYIPTETKKPLVRLIGAVADDGTLIETPEKTTQHANSRPTVSEPVTDETTESEETVFSTPDASDEATALAEEAEAVMPQTETAEVSSDTPTKQEAEIAPTPTKQPKKEYSVQETVKKRNGLSEDDVSMLLELGYENDLGHLVGQEPLKQLKYDHLRRTRYKQSQYYRTSFGYRGKEYSDIREREEVLAAYEQDRRHLLMRTLLTALATLLLLFIDMPYLVGTPLTDAAKNTPRLFPVLGLVLLLFASLLSLRELNAGARRLLKFAPTPYSVCALLIPLSFIYSIIGLFINLPEMYFPVALVLLVTTLCDVLRISCEIRAFRILCADGVKTVLESTQPRRKKLRQGNKIVKIINDDTAESFYRIRNAEQAVGFFRRFNTMESAARPFSILLFTALALSTLLAFAHAIYTASLVQALHTFLSILLICTPISAIFSYFYPIFHANRLLSKRNCALLGEEAVEELEGRKTVIFGDTELLTAKKYTEIAVCDSDDLSRDLSLVNRLFRKLGGTLGQLCDGTAPDNEEKSCTVRISENGVEAMLEGAYHVLIGNGTFMKKNGIHIPEERTDRALRRTPNTALMHVAIDGILKFNYEIEYGIRPEFEEVIADLAFHHTTVGIRTYDPNLSDRFLTLLRGEDADPVRVLHPVRYEDELPLEILDTGAVALDAPDDINSVLYAATGVATARRFGMRMQLIASILGSVGAVLLAVFGKAAALGIFSIVGYQFFWVLISLIGTHSELNRSTLHLK